jgi:polysaccharide export outer membrane protein
MMSRSILAHALLATGLAAVTLGAQSTAPPTTAVKPPAAAAPTTPAQADPKAVPSTSEYIIGPDDVLSVVFWREKDVSGDVTVRPDGKISLPLINELQAAGLTANELMANVTAAAKKYFDDPSVSIVVKQINSRKVFITGAVGKPGPYALTDHMTVVQLIAMAGGLQEFADRKHIVIVHRDLRPDGVPWSHNFNYEDFTNRLNLNSNLELKPGDTVVVK